jgi:hypothetical protein
MKNDSVRLFLRLEGIFVGVPAVVLILGSLLDALLPRGMPGPISGPLFFGFAFYRLPALLVVPPLRTLSMHWSLHYTCVFAVHTLLLLAISLLIGFIRQRASNNAIERYR